MTELIAFISIWIAWKAHTMPGPCLDTYRQEAAACAVYEPGTLARQLCEAEALGRYEGCVLSERAIEPPPDCTSMRIDWWCGDYNLDGGVDGADLEAFIPEWADGYARTDVDGDTIAGTECDWVLFMAAWADGEMQGCY